MFRDKFNREIRIGHVLANGGRDGCSGIIRTGIVRGFTESSILVDMILPVGPYNTEMKNYTQWATRRGSFREPKLCLITGLDAETFLDSVNAAGKPPESVEPAPVSFMDTSNILGPIWRNLLASMRPDEVVEGTAIINNGAFLPSDPVEATEKPEDVNIYE